MTDYTPSPEAVEAAARAIHERRCHYAETGFQCNHEPTAAERTVALADATAALTAAGPLIAAEALREAAQWLAATNYPVDWYTDVSVPDALWEALVDVIHEDADGNWHGRTLPREDVESWLADEAGRIEGGDDRG